MATESSTPSSIKYQPKFGRVLIKREIKQMSSGGIIIPDSAAKRNASCEGVIIALGETAGWTESYDSTGNPVTIQTLKIGDKVVFGRHAGAWLDMTSESKDDGTLYICQDQDILATVEQ